MPSTHSTPRLPIADLLGRFLAARRPALTPRTGRIYDDLSTLLVDFLGERRIHDVPCDPAFGGAAGATLGQLHREQRAAIDAICELWDDGFVRVLGSSGAPRDALRIAEAMLRDLGRWLRTARIAPPEAGKTGSRRRPAHASARPRPSARATPRLTVATAQPEAQP